MTRRPGQWPIARPVPVQDEETNELALRQRRNAEQARFHITLGSVRADLEEQPSPACVHSAARRWCAAITAIADEISKQKRSTG